jgi:ABC-type antimicrobial peptide transport system permease subunit
LWCSGWSLALGIGVIGVYSLIAYIVNWRTREIGIRLALGASRWEILTHILKQSMALSMMASFAGLVVAMAAARLLKSFLFEINPVDPFTFCAVPILMVLLALIAAWIPARRAASVDPTNALRAD